IYTEQLKGLVLAPGVIGVGHNLSGNRVENQFTPMANVEWDLNPRTMLYASATSGYKAGGFDGRANNPYSFEFEDEKAIAYEIGAKNYLFDRTLELNVDYFYTDYRNLQVSQFDGVFGFNVGNAKKARTQGIELDGRWAITDAWTLAYSYAWLDFRFTDFQNGNCYDGQVPNGVTLSNGVHMCDYSGETGQYSPKNSAALSLDYKRALDSRWLMTGSLMYNFRGSEQIHDNHDPRMQQPGVGRIDLRIGIEDKNWRLAFIGKNLANEKVLSYAGNVPLTYSLFGTNTYFAFVERPRQLALDVSYSF
ncbi:MAG TPA: TonB-dependent receptor, partial [Candidatus Acidoferrum sp.]|nr:TonB-dependent receptor [Candidatus Acidoferrum sp.]